MYIYFKNLITILAISLLFTACSQKELGPTIFETNKEDIVEFSKEANSIKFEEDANIELFFKRYFKPWTQTSVSYPKNEAMWGFLYRHKNVYLENHQLASTDWFEKQIENSNFDEYNINPQKAISIKNTNVRLFPTNSPMFYNPKLPGEGFPFDYNQNSLIKINTPLIVSHLSKDRAWAYVESHFVGGWVQINDIAFVDDEFIKEFSTNNYYIAVKERFTLYDPIFREYVKIGTIFPKSQDKYIVAKQDDNLKAKIQYIDIEDTNIERMPLLYSVENRARVLNEFINEPYGWGGFLNNRDCSSFTQDYFSVFGKYLNRNSKAQTTNGKYYDISKLTLEEKKDFIMKNAVPFSTLIYLRGHIMLYIGLKNSEPIVVHNVWSIKLKDKNDKEFRYIIGKTAVTTLEPGLELEGFDDNSSSILARVLGIVIL